MYDEDYIPTDEDIENANRRSNRLGCATVFFIACLVLFIITVLATIPILR